MTTVLENGEVLTLWEVRVSDSECTDTMHFCTHQCRSAHLGDTFTPSAYRLVLGSECIDLNTNTVRCAWCGVVLNDGRADRFATRLVLVLIVLALLYIGAHVALAVSRGDLPPRDCQEDDPCWDCEAMGNKVCGPVNVEQYPEGDHTWVQVWDSRGRMVFGPVRLAS